MHSDQSIYAYCTGLKNVIQFGGKPLYPFSYYFNYTQQAYRKPHELCTATRQVQQRKSLIESPLR